MKAANYAPMYCALYPQLAEIARAHGYALAVHGTLGRDMDLICVPWVEQPDTPESVLADITNTFAVRLIGGVPSLKPHGRRAWTLSIGFGECAIAISFIPAVAPLQPVPVWTPGEPPAEVEVAWLAVDRVDPDDGSIAYRTTVLCARDATSHGLWCEAGDWRGESTMDEVLDGLSNIVAWMAYTPPEPPPRATHGGKR